MSLFNAIPGKLRDTMGVKTDTFKRNLDKWLSSIMDKTLIDNYKAETESNSIVHQPTHRRNEE